MSKCSATWVSILFFQRYPRLDWPANQSLKIYQVTNNNHIYPTPLYTSKLSMNYSLVYWQILRKYFLLFRFWRQEKWMSLSTCSIFLMFWNFTFVYFERLIAYLGRDGYKVARHISSYIKSKHAYLEFRSWLQLLKGTVLQDLTFSN